MSTGAIREPSGEQPEYERDGLARARDDTDQRRRRAVRGQIRTDDAARAFVDEVTQAAYQPEHEDEAQRRDPIRLHRRCFVRHRDVPPSSNTANAVLALSGISTVLRR